MIVDILNTYQTDRGDDTPLENLQELPQQDKIEAYLILGDMKDTLNDDDGRIRKRHNKLHHL
jgi:hypothetical protein